jgi:hypothetical protein
MSLNIDKKVEVIARFIEGYERMRDKLHFPVKTPLDKLICPICGKKYTRKNKAVHAKRRLHKKMLKYVLEGTVMPYIEWSNVTIN